MPHPQFSVMRPSSMDRRSQARVGQRHSQLIERDTLDDPADHSVDRYQSMQRQIDRLLAEVTATIARRLVGGT